MRHPDDPPTELAVNAFLSAAIARFLTDSYGIDCLIEANTSSITITPTAESLATVLPLFEQSQNMGG